MRDTVVYLGPSLSRLEASSILQADYLPPICRGDLAKLPKGTKTVGIIDGEFYQNLAVSSKEILTVLDRGIKVFGAASMGALRAAETYMFGTVGVGEIFVMFRDGTLDGDDEVALVYDPQSYRQLSEPLVNIRRALKMALAEGAINEEEMNRLLSQMKSCYFPDRSFTALQSLCPALVDFFRDSALPDLKRDDARRMLIAINNTRLSPIHEDREHSHHDSFQSGSYLAGSRALRFPIR
jgi:TfuA protein